MNFNSIRKTVLLVSLLALSLGFRVWDGGITWNVNSNDPYLWIKLNEPDKEFENNFPDTDNLANQTLTKSTIVQSVFDDINNLDTTYLKLELYPQDPDDPPANSHFTTSKGTGRIIYIESGEPGALGASGFAKTESDGKNITKCTIKIESASESDAKIWMGTFAHELGHCLGLLHPQELVHAIMSYYAKGDPYRYQIDDLMGLSFLYPDPDTDLKESPTYGLSCSVK